MKTKHLLITVLATVLTPLLPIYSVNAGTIRSGQESVFGDKVFDYSEFTYRDGFIGFFDFKERNTAAALRGCLKSSLIGSKTF